MRRRIPSHSPNDGETFVGQLAIGVRLPSRMMSTIAAATNQSAWTINRVSITGWRMLKSPTNPRICNVAPKRAQGSEQAWKDTGAEEHHTQWKEEGGSDQEDVLNSLDEVVARHSACHVAGHGRLDPGKVERDFHEAHHQDGRPCQQGDPTDKTMGGAGEVDERQSEDHDQQ